MTIRARFLTALAIAVGWTAPLGAANVVVFEQSPDPAVVPGASSPFPVEEEATGFRAADDFLLARDATIRDLRWWGLHDPMSSGQDDFTFTFYDDASGLPGNVLMETRGDVVVMPDAAIAKLNFYRAALEEPFNAAAGQSYWLSIFNAEPSAAWSWNNSLDGNDRSAYFRLPSDNVWMANLVSDGDLAFQVVIPEPAAPAIAGTAWAVLGLVIRRRRKQVARTSVYPPTD